MSLAPSFSPPCFVTYGNNNNLQQQRQQQQLHQTHYHSPQPHYNHSFSAERRRRVTLLHGPKKQLPKNNHFTTITTTTTITTPKTIPKQQQEQQQNNNSGIKKLSSSTATTTNNKNKKTVRFYEDDKLENIRMFLKTQKPSAIRDGDPALSLELKYPNWPAKTTMSMRHLPMIRMEGVQAASSQQTTLIGRCRVANLAFEKHVVVRYTTDYWQSFHETAALYREPIGSSCNTWDRFTFLIDLEDLFVRRRCRDNTATIYLALRYTVNEKEYWDNNDGLNYQIDITPTTHDDNDKEPMEPIATTIIDNKLIETSLATIEKEEGQALHRGNIQKKPVKQQDQHKKHQHQQPQQQQKSITSKNASTTTITTITTTTTTTTTKPSPTSTPNSIVNNSKKKLGHRYDFGASLSEAKKTPYDVYQFGKGPMVQFSTLTKQEEDSNDGFQSRYHDFVNKYCFYGTNYSSPASSPPSSLSCPPSEPICG